MPSENQNPQATVQKPVRFGAFVREVTLQQHKFSANDLIADVETDATGKIVRRATGRLTLRPLDVYRLLQPYVTVRFKDQLKAVVPLAAYLALFQLVILRQNVTDSWVITAGIVSVIVGLMLFMEGLKVGLMPFGETIGGILPSKASLPVVLLITFLLGIGVTFAEPAIGALKAAGAIVDVERAPYLYALLNEWSGHLVLMVGVGVGLAAVLGTTRFIYGWSLKPLIYMTLVPLIALTAYLAADPRMQNILGLAWDCGAVTTGPVTVPLVLSLGVGMAMAAAKGRSSLSGFGIVTLASLFPIIAVYMLAIYVTHTVDAATIVAGAALETGATNESWLNRTPFVEIVSGVRAILPLVIFLILVMRFVLGEKVRRPLIVSYGISLAILGMIIFNVGLSYGLSKLGGQSGGLVPGAFTQIAVVPDSPLYTFSLGLSITILFAWLLGFGATMAEPALNALGITVENLSNGAFRKSMLIYAVSFGVGTGIALGVSKIIFAVPIAYLIIPGYTIAVALTMLSSEEYVNIAWDSAGVTTGPITVPLVLAMGLGLGNAVGAVDGFGILAMASIGPIIAVLATGLWVRWKIARRHRDESVESELDEVTAS